MKQVSIQAKQGLLALQRAVIDAYDKKRRLGQCAIIYRNGRVMAVGEDAPDSLKPGPGEEITLEELIKSAKKREAVLAAEIEETQG